MLLLVIRLNISSATPTVNNFGVNREIILRELRFSPISSDEMEIFACVIAAVSALSHRKRVTRGTNFLACTMKTRRIYRLFVCHMNVGPLSRRASYFSGTPRSRRTIHPSANRGRYCPRSGTYRLNEAPSYAEPETRLYRTHRLASLMFPVSSDFIFPRDATSNDLNLTIQVLSKY